VAEDILGGRSNRRNRRSNGVSDSRKRSPTQLELPFTAAAKPTRQSPPPPASVAAPVAKNEVKAPKNTLRVIKGGGQRVREALSSRDAVVRVLVEAGADMLLRRISVERAEEIQQNVDLVLELFDRVDASPELMPKLKKSLDELEALMTETRSVRNRQHGR
jgi:hypothetical protein